MAIQFVYKILPVLVKYVDGAKDDLGGFAGFSYGPYIKIKKSYKDDAGLLVHELTHSRQFYRTFGLWGLLYKNRKYRLKYEVEAYKAQFALVAVADRDRLADKFAGLVATKYNVSVDQASVKRLLLQSVGS